MARTHPFLPSGALDETDAFPSNVALSEYIADNGMLRPKAPRARKSIVICSRHDRSGSYPQETPRGSHAAVPADIAVPLGLVAFCFTRARPKTPRRLRLGGGRGAAAKGGTAYDTPLRSDVSASANAWCKTSLTEARLASAGVRSLM